MPNVDGIDIAALKATTDNNALSIADMDVRIAKLETEPASTVLPIITDAQLVQALRTLLTGSAATPGAGTTSSGSTTAPGPVSIPTDTNQYPFAMPENIAPAAPVVLGSGPDALDLLISNSPGQPLPCVFNVIVKRADGTQTGIAGPLTCSSYVGQQQAGAQHFGFRGSFGPGATFTIAPGAGGAGVNGMFLMGASYNLIPLGIWGQIDSRGGDAGGGAWTYNSNGNAMTLSDAPPPGYTAPVPAPTDTLINGMTITQLAKTGAFSLPAGTFVGTAALTGNVLGAGLGKTMVDAGNHPLTFQKAIFVPTVPGITIKDLTLTGAAVVNGGNGAGIRDASDNIGFSANNVEIHDCQNGILTFGSDITLNGCHFHDNGNPTDGGHTHNVYVGGSGSNTLTVSDYIGSGAKSAHDIKSRAAVTKIDKMISTAGGQGRCLDVPDGGKVDVSNSSWTIPPGADDRTFFGFATENTGPNPAVARNGDGGVVTLTNLILDDQTNQGGQLLCGTYDTKAALNLVNCTYKGAVAPKLVGWGSVTGQIAKAG